MSHSTSSSSQTLRIPVSPPRKNVEYKETKQRTVSVKEVKTNPSFCDALASLLHYNGKSELLRHYDLTCFLCSLGLFFRNEIANVVPPNLYCVSAFQPLSLVIMPGSNQLVIDHNCSYPKVVLQSPFRQKRHMLPTE